ncbi:hypothetical protein BDZ45DRAFT_672478 [Acephala macrosclerotiorum]|nr:hypothetical protein BDZ45DRAFT_672478 [Acephala macrosclerotiorum]
MSIPSNLTAGQRKFLAEYQQSTDAGDDVTLEHILGLLPFVGPDGDIDFEKHQEEMVKIIDPGSSQQYTSFLTASEARTTARMRSDKIFEHWTALQKILQRHEEIIRKRWLKKSREQRTKIIQTAWNRPNLATTHRPDFTAFMKEEKALHQQKKTRFLDAYMWPSINTEDLVKGKTLLLFINSRGRHPPDLFIHADFRSTSLGWNCLAIRNAVCLNYTMMFSERRTPDTYGELVSWYDNPEAPEWMSSGIGFQPGEGIVLLEIQEEILRFLIRCCQLLMQDAPVAELIKESIPIQPEPPSVSMDDSLFPSLVAMSFESPYRQPAHLDFDRVRSMAASSRSAAEDHIWALREDPGYFYEMCIEEKEHLSESLPDTRGEMHPTFKDPSKLWDKVLGSVVHDAYERFIIADVLCQLVDDVVMLKEKYQDQISVDHPLPPDYELAFQKLKFFIDKSVDGPCQTLNRAVPTSPPMRSLFVREPYFPGEPGIQKRFKSESGLNKDKLMWILYALFNKDHVSVYGLPNLMEVLYHLLQTEPKQNERISWYVARVLSLMAQTGEILRQLDMYEPWATKLAEKRKEETLNVHLTAFHLHKLKPYLAPLSNFHKAPSLEKFGNPTDGRFDYPVGRRRTKETTEKMRKAEQSLDAFWTKIDYYYKDDKGVTQHQYLVRNIFKAGNRELQRTPEWVEPTPSNKTSTSIVERQTEQSQLLYEPFSFLSIQDQPSKYEPVSQPKTKSKTRGTANPGADNSLPDTAPTTQHDIQPTFTLGKRAFKTISTLFHNPGQGGQPGEVSWPDFLYAMVAVGFAPQKLYGSIWQFTPNNLDVERSIQFHEPHPYGKIPFRNARRIGRRLNRAYGWTGKMFVLE